VRRVIRIAQLLVQARCATGLIALRADQQIVKGILALNRMPC
jgi:hypothetical protein